MKVNVGLAIVFSLFILGCSEPNREKEADKEVSSNIESVKEIYLNKIDSIHFYLEKMDSSKSIGENRELFLEVRKWYKRAEPLIIAFDYENYKTINGPNLLKVDAEDATNIKKIKPRSFQVLEELLFDEYDPAELQRQLFFLRARIPFMGQNHIFGYQKDRHFLEAIRMTIVNIATKGLTGFDSPMLLNSMKETAYNYETIQELIDIHKERFSSVELYNRWGLEVNASLDVLETGDFDSFDRYSFIKSHINKQLELINQTASDWEVALSFSMALNPKSTNLFDSVFFSQNHFAGSQSPKINLERVNLGKKLFYDEGLSKDGKMSCASCHKQELAFTDGKVKATDNNGKELLRNSPTLSYSGYQRAFFLDATSLSLESQIAKVVNNTREFHMNLELLEEKVKSDSSYVNAFDKAYNRGVSDRNIRNAIAAFVRSLSPFNSKFDRNMQGKEETLSDQEITGFNLFMGKAACATCHFPPAFNGTVPPKYLESEIENLGVPKYADFNHPDQKIDDDPGAYYPFEVEEKKHFFKTPTIRNIAYTAPYMHNGVYQTLEEVIHFYDVGGGAGMGLDVPCQTLPPDSLSLSQEEKDALIAFMKTLSDPMTDY